MTILIIINKYQQHLKKHISLFSYYLVSDGRNEEECYVLCKHALYAEIVYLSKLEQDDPRAWKKSPSCRACLSCRAVTSHKFLRDSWDDPWKSPDSSGNKPWEELGRNISQFETALPWRKLSVRRCTICRRCDFSRFEWSWLQKSLFRSNHLRVALAVSEIDTSWKCCDPRSSPTRTEKVPKQPDLTWIDSVEEQREERADEEELSPVPCFRGSETLVSQTNSDLLQACRRDSTGISPEVVNLSCANLGRLIQLSLQSKLVYTVLIPAKLFVVPFPINRSSYPNSLLSEFWRKMKPGKCFLLSYFVFTRRTASLWTCKVISLLIVLNWLGTEPPERLEGKLKFH